MVKQNLFRNITQMVRLKLQLVTIQKVEERQQNSMQQMVKRQQQNVKMEHIHLQKSVVERVQDIMEFLLGTNKKVLVFQFSHI